MDTSFFSPEAKSYIDQATAYAQRPGQNVQNSLRNRAFTSGNVTAPFYGAAASTTIIGAALLVARTSGIFVANVSWAWVQATPGTYRWQIGTQTVASGLSLTAATKVGPGPAGGVFANGAYISSGATIAVTGGGGAQVVFDTGVQTIGTVATAGTFDYSAIVQDSIAATTETIFPIGNQVLLTVTLITATAAATVSASTGGYAFDFYELP
jgi:hypothetical protein